MLHRFKIFGPLNTFVGVIFAKTDGEARIKAVADRLVNGRKQITKVEKIEEDEYNIPI